MNNDFRKNYKLIQAREEMKFSQEDIAKKANMTPNTYARKENGQTQFKVDEINVILAILGKQYNEIFLP